jgi:hypothetical protein
VGEAVCAESCVASRMFRLRAPSPWRELLGSHKPCCLVIDNLNFNTWMCATPSTIECCHPLEYAYTNPSVHASGRAKISLRPPLGELSPGRKNKEQKVASQTTSSGSLFPCGLSTIATRAAARILPDMYWLGTDISSTILCGSSFARLLWSWLTSARLLPRLRT